VVSVEETLLPFEVAGLTFRNQFLVASGPTTKNIGQLQEAERWGWGGVSLKLAIDPPPYINRPPRYRYWKTPKYLGFAAETRLTLEQALRLTEAGRKKTKDLIILANITYAGDRGMEGWMDMARKLVAAGAHAVELNMCCPNMSFNIQVSGGGKRTPQTGASLGQNAEIVGGATEVMVKALDVPIFVKLTPEGGKIAEVAKACFEKGASAVVTTANRLGIPDFDINSPAQGPYRLQQEPCVACLSGGWIKPLSLRDVFEMRTRVGPDHCIVGTGGVRNYVDAVQMMMCGADMVGICTETMLSGFDFLPGLVKNLKKFMAERGYGSYRDFRDAFARAVTPADKLTLTEAYAQVDPNLCTGCGRCVKVGHCYAISLKDGKAVIVPGDCTGCSTCMDVCPVAAISFVEKK
jgi:dihydroorotate dehydrogenase/NAD-dependent dihydropyrimidine dehydrogenase PreA subunit